MHPLILCLKLNLCLYRKSLQLLLISPFQFVNFTQKNVNNFYIGLPPPIYVMLSVISSMNIIKILIRSALKTLGKGKWSQPT